MKTRLSAILNVVAGVASLVFAGAVFFVCLWTLLGFVAGFLYFASLA